ncbi:MAG: ABC transporter ATP-binding protein, partial [Microthrixaceae bacterium]|nr:ABC transporter ATP-binding protein [Microthrixaceae bacterium]
MGPGAWRQIGSLSRDRSVKDHKFAPGTIKRILGFGRPYRRSVILLVALILMDAVLSALVPLIYREIIDVGIAEQRSSLVVGLAGALGVLAIVGSVNSLFQRWYSSRIGEGLIFDLRNAVFDHVQRQPIAFFTRTQTGSLVTRLNSDVIGAQQAFTSTLTNVVGNVATLIATLVAMLLLSWQITLLSLLLLPLFILPARYIAPRLSAITRERYQVDGAMGQMMTERFNVSGALLIKLFGHPRDEADEFSRRAGRVRDIGVTTAMYGRIVMVALTLMAALATALVYGLGGVFVVKGGLAVGTLVALTAYLNRLYAPLTALSNVQVDVMTTLVSFERVFEVLDLEPMIAEPVDPVAFPRAVDGVSIEFNDVSFRYPAPTEVSIASLESVESTELSSEPNRLLLSGVSFTVDAGKMVALVGPSGAGKSTIASLVPRLYDVTGGSVALGGVDVRSIAIDDLRDHVGVVSQDSHLFHETLRNNLLLASPNASSEEIRLALESAQIWPLV